MTPVQDLRWLHRTLALASRLVPAAKREAWRAEWLAEIIYAYREDPSEAMRLAQGMIPDALTLRITTLQARGGAIDWRAPMVCLRLLAAVLLVSCIAGAAQPHVRHLVFSTWGQGAFACFTSLALLSFPSTVVTSRYHAYERFDGDAATFRQRLVRWRFLVCKLVLVILSSYLLAVEVTQPFVPLLGQQADWLLVGCGLLLNVLAINWVFTDQKARCPTCLRSLRNPAHMGPPSWSLLDVNATEEMCDRGHGLSHQPEWETSWFENARWLQLDGTWRSLFHP